MYVMIQGRYEEPRSVVKAGGLVSYVNAGCGVQCGEGVHLKCALLWLVYKVSIN